MLCVRLGTQQKVLVLIQECWIIAQCRTTGKPQLMIRDCLCGRWSFGEIPSSGSSYVERYAEILTSSLELGNLVPSAAHTPFSLLFHFLSCYQSFLIYLISFLQSAGLVLEFSVLLDWPGLKTNLYSHFIKTQTLNHISVSNFIAVGVDVKYKSNNCVVTSLVFLSHDSSIP